MARTRSALGTASYRVWLCEECGSMFDRDGKPPPVPSSAEQMAAWNQIKVGLRVRRRRVALEWTLRELENRSGVSRATLNRIESGKVSSTLVVITRLAATLQVDTGVLTAGLVGWPVAGNGTCPTHGTPPQ